MKQEFVHTNYVQLADQTQWVSTIVFLRFRNKTIKKAYLATSIETYIILHKKYKYDE